MQGETTSVKRATTFPTPLSPAAAPLSENIDRAGWKALSDRKPWLRRRRELLWLALAVWLAAVGWTNQQTLAAPPNIDGQPAACDADRRFGTAIVWAESLDEAARLAKEQGKLVFVLQVSGHFARDAFT